MVDMFRSTNVKTLLNEVKILETNIFILASEHSKKTRFFFLHNTGQIKIEDSINYEVVVIFVLTGASSWVQI